MNLLIDDCQKKFSIRLDLVWMRESKFGTINAKMCLSFARKIAKLYLHERIYCILFSEKKVKEIFPKFSAAFPLNANRIRLMNCIVNKSKYSRSV